MLAAGQAPQLLPLLAGPALGFVLHLPVTTTCKPGRAAVAANHCRAITRWLTGCGGQQRAYPG